MTPVRASRRAGKSMGRIIFDNASIFDGTGRAPFAGRVLVDGEHIAQVAKVGEPLLGASDAEKIDCTGRTLMPGLIEAHAHLTWPSSIERFEPRFVLPP